MKNENFKFRTWVLMFNDLFFIAPTNLIDEDTPDTSKFVTLAKIKKTGDNEHTSFIYGNTDFLPKFNEGKVDIQVKETADQAMLLIEESLEAAYPVNVEPEEPE